MPCFTLQTCASVSLEKTNACDGLRTTSCQRATASSEAHPLNSYLPEELFPGKDIACGWDDKGTVLPEAAALPRARDFSLPFVIRSTSNRLNENSLTWRTYHSRYRRLAGIPSTCSNGQKYSHNLQACYSSASRESPLISSGAAAGYGSCGFAVVCPVILWLVPRVGHRFQTVAGASRWLLFVPRELARDEGAT